jgi:hypothetical protein
MRPAAAATAVRLVRSVRQGEALQYRVISQYEVSDTRALPRTRFDLDVTYSQRVVKVTRDGIVRLELRPIRGTSKEHGIGDPAQRVQPGSAPKFSAQMTKAGVLVEFHGLPYEAPQLVGVWGTIDPVPLYNWFVGFSGFPDRDVQPGDSWGRRATVSFIGAGKFHWQVAATVVSSSKLLRLETIGKRRCAVIESEVTLPVGKMRPPSRQAGISSRASGDLHISTTNYVDLADGTLLRSEGHFTSKEAYAVTFGTGSRAAKPLSGTTELNGSIHVALEPSGR